MPKWNWDDGGRREWGMPVSTRDRDCAVRALAIATRRPYGDIWNVLNDLCVNATGRPVEENGVPDYIARAVYRRCAWRPWARFERKDEDLHVGARSGRCRPFSNDMG